MTALREVTDAFTCFGSSCSVLVTGDGPGGSPVEVVARARSRMLGWHRSFSRFEPDSELSRLNRDPRTTVAVSPLMARFAASVVRAGELTGGLVDATLVEEIETVGYRDELGEPPPLETALAAAPARSPARASDLVGWSLLDVDLASATITRPPGVMLDSGGLAKGLFADVLAAELAGHEAFAVNCAGDLAIGGDGKVSRPVRVQSPFDGGIIHSFDVRAAGVATSGIGRRSWSDATGAPAHHLLDPHTGRPAFTGVVQVTAIAPSALLAEVRAKAAILSGPARAARWLPDGGVMVLDDASHTVIAPLPSVTVGQLSAYAPDGLLGGRTFD